MSQAASLDSSSDRDSASPKSASARLPFGLTLGLFVVSGATGLVDQLCFSKYLGYVVGSTAHAVSAVLAAFMTGLAVGAHFGGKWSARIRRPLVAYGVLEGVVALAVALTPLGFRVLTPLYAALARMAPESLAVLSVLRWCVALLLVVVPTMAMGATLPLLSRGIEASEPTGGSRRERRLSALYAANTLGGATGALAAAYVIVPALGLNYTLYVSALGSGLVGLAAAWKGRGVVVENGTGQPVVASRSEDAATAAGPASAASGRSAPSPRDTLLLALLAFLSGSLVFACEVLFTHLLALIIGNSAYAFGLILAAFLTSLFLGASLAGTARRWLSDAALPLGLAATAGALLITLPYWDELPRLFANTGDVAKTFEQREAVRGLTALAILLIPTSLMGLTFPLLLQRVAGYDGVGGWVGRLTAINTIGAVVGALGTGYVVLPLLGSQSSLLAIGVGFGASALLALPWVQGGARWVTVGLSGSAALFGVLSPRWDLSELTSGANVYFEGQPSTQKVVSIHEDVHGGVTTVALSEGVYTLYTNGKFQGNTGWEMNAQRFFAHYPSIFVEHFDDALIIGLGTGTTLGTLATYPWKRLHVVEISPSIVSAARQYFQVPNRGAIDDPRVTLTHADGRNHLLVSNRRYDLIGMELSSIWFAGASSLYSDEFYRLVASRLNPGGVFQQWVQLHHVYKDDFATIVHTLRKNFPHVALFYGGGQGILVASFEPFRASRERLKRLQALPNLHEVLPYGRPLEELLDDVLVLDSGLDAFLASCAAEAGTPLSDLISTDENLYLEYATPRGNVLPWAAREALVADLKSYQQPDAISALLVP
ncbi:MAG TPA: fused MFS/spermidine synthase [Polyangiaceae bacterium]|nr:fused MFS/spermidine synthase [Polyangiaceae bacterium]